MIRQDAHDHDNKFEAYHYELIRLMPCLGLHITKRINQGSVLQMIKFAMPLVTMKGGNFPGNVMDDRMKLYTGGVTT